MSFGILYSTTSADWARNCQTSLLSSNKNYRKFRTLGTRFTSIFFFIVPSSKTITQQNKNVLNRCLTHKYDPKRIYHSGSEYIKSKDNEGVLHPPKSSELLPHHRNSIMSYRGRSFSGETLTLFKEYSQSTEPTTSQYSAKRSEW